MNQGSGAYDTPVWLKAAGPVGPVRRLAAALDCKEISIKGLSLGERKCPS